MILNDGQVVDYTKDGVPKMDKRFEPQPLENIVVTEITIAKEEELELSVDDIYEEVNATQVDLPWERPIVHTSGFIMPIGDVPLSPVPEESYVVSNRGFTSTMSYPPSNSLLDVEATIKAKLDILKGIHRNISMPDSYKNALLIRLVSDHSNMTGYIEALEYVIGLIEGKR